VVDDVDGLEGERTGVGAPVAEEVRAVVVGGPDPHRGAVAGDHEVVDGVRAVEVERRGVQSGLLSELQRFTG
jgi:hypothetical protein